MREADLDCIPKALTGDPVSGADSLTNVARHSRRTVFTPRYFTRNYCTLVQRPTEPPTFCAMCGQRHGFGDRNHPKEIHLTLSPFLRMNSPQERWPRSSASQETSRGECLTWFLIWKRLLRRSNKIVDEKEALPRGYAQGIAALPDRSDEGRYHRR